jgi:hypothetical protein
MAKKKAKQTRRKKTSIKDLSPRKQVKGGLAATRLGLRRPVSIS